MANNELSGPVISIEILKWIKKNIRKHIIHTDLFTDQKRLGQFIIFQGI